MKLGRNDPCWCGSGKKFKKCHFDRHSEPAAKISEVIEACDRAYQSKYCSHPDTSDATCSTKIIAAHTLSRAAFLSPIAREGHVYAFAPRSLGQLFANQGKLTPALTGIGKASTFSGFCSKHDNSIFRAIDRTSFTGTPEQLFLLAYRPACRELYAKRAYVNSLNFMRTMDRGAPLERQMVVQSTASLAERGAEVGISDIESFKTSLDRILKTAAFSDLRSHILRFEGAPSIACSGATQPLFDASERRLQDLLDVETENELMSFNLLPVGDHSIAVFTAPKHSRVLTELYESFEQVPPEDRADAVIRFSFRHFENIFGAPGWWEGLAEEQKALLIDDLRSGVDPKAALEPTATSEALGGLVDWTSSSEPSAGS